MPDGRVLIAEGNPLAASPSWERFDELAACRCNGMDINSGRQSEFDKTDTGHATVFFHDRNGTVNDAALVGLPVQLQVRNPVSGLWVPQYRGVIDDFTYDVDPSGVLSNVQMECVDMFDYLGGVEMVPVEFGDPAPAGSEGLVFYPEGPVATGTDDPLDGGRIENLLDDGLVPSELYIVFSGNVDLLPTKYDIGDSLLIAIRDAVDAEFPGAGATAYIDRAGRFNFHGRLARFTPDAVAAASPWDFRRWAGGDGAAIALDSDRAQLRRFSFNRPRSRIINSAVCYPRDIPRQDIFFQTFVDTVSRDAYGYHGWAAQDLIIKGHKTNGNTGAEECQLFAQFHIAAYSVPRTSIKSVTFKSIRPGDPRADKTWDLMLSSEISDILNLSVGAANVTDEDFYIEGFRTSIRYLNPEFDYVEFTPNLSPFAYYADAFPEI